MRRMPLVLLAVALVLSLGGCGEDEKKDAPLDLGDSADQPSRRGTGPTAEQEPFDDKGHEAIRGKVDATTPEEKAVVDAWLDYWSPRQELRQAEVDTDLGQFAAATAVSDVVEYVGTSSRKAHTVGDTKFDVSEIAMDGDSALSPAVR